MPSAKNSPEKIKKDTLPRACMVALGKESTQIKILKFFAEGLYGNPRQTNYQNKNLKKIFGEGPTLGPRQRRRHLQLVA